MKDIEQIAVYTILIIIIIICSIIIRAVFRNTKDYNQETYAEVYNEMNVIEEHSLDFNGEKIKYYSNGEEVQTKLVIGIVDIPSLNARYPIIYKTTDEYLKMAPTKLSGPDPNKSGNCCVIGHNYENNLFFSRIDELRTDDIVRVTSKDGEEIEYKVFSSFECESDDWSCSDSVNLNRREFTLVTCTNNKDKRLVVRCAESV